LVPWYAAAVAMGDDGQLVRIGGPIPAVAAKPSEELALAFVQEGKELKRYTIGELLKGQPVKGSGPAGETCLLWLARAPGFDKKGKWFEVTLVDGSSYMFDPATGKILQRSIDETVLKGTPLGIVPVSGGLKATRAARGTAASYRAFGLGLYARLRGGAQADRNLVFCPLDLAANLTVVGAGARGQTAKGFGKVLHLPASAPGWPDQWVRDLRQLYAVVGMEPALKAAPEVKGLPILRSCVSLWAGKDLVLTDAYTKALAELPGVAVRQVDPAKAGEAVKQINDEVRKATRGKIADLLSPGDVSAETKAVLASATFLAAGWLYPFTPTAAPQPFHVDEKRSVKVATLTNLQSYRAVRDPDADALELPYRQGRLSMVILLPDHLTPLSSFEDSLSDKRLDELLSAIDAAAPRPVAVSLPKFKIASRKYSLKEPLAELGLAAAFGGKADFSGLSSKGNLELDKVIHQTVLEVDEYGTVAAAATASPLLPRRRPADAGQFIVERPFVFLIRDRASGAVLFLGRVVDPSRET
jgi:serpin B